MERNGPLKRRNIGRKLTRIGGVSPRIKKKKTKTSNLIKLSKPKNIRTSLKEFSPELIRLSKWLRAVQKNRRIFNISRLKTKGLIVMGPNNKWILSKKGERVIRTLYNAGF